MQNRPLESDAQDVNGNLVDDSALNKLLAELEQHAIPVTTPEVTPAPIVDTAIALEDADAWWNAVEAKENEPSLEPIKDEEHSLDASDAENAELNEENEENDESEEFVESAEASHSEGEDANDANDESELKESAPFNFNALLAACVKLANKLETDKKQRYYIGSQSLARPLQTEFIREFLEGAEKETDEEKQMTIAFQAINFIKHQLYVESNFVYRLKSSSYNTYSDLNKKCIEHFHGSKLSSKEIGKIESEALRDFYINNAKRIDAFLTEVDGVNRTTKMKAISDLRSEIKATEKLIGETAANLQATDTQDTTNYSSPKDIEEKIARLKAGSESLVGNRQKLEALTSQCDKLCMEYGLPAFSAVQQYKRSAKKGEKTHTGLSVIKMLPPEAKKNFGLFQPVVVELDKKNAAESAAKLSPSLSRKNS